MAEHYDEWSRSQLIAALAETEEALRTRSDSAGTQKLLHELQVHQIELELQNRELREAQRRLEESRDRYADLYDFAPVGYFTCDPRGVIAEINLTAARLLETERARLIGKPLAVFVVAEDGPAFARYLRQMDLETGPQAVELRFKTRSRTTLDVRLEGVAIPAAGAAGQVCRIALTDITERRQGERTLARTLARLATAERIAHLGHWEHDLAVDQGYWSEETRHIFGASPHTGTLTFAAVLERIHPDDRAAFAAAWQAALAGQRPLDIEYRLARPDGSIRYVHSQAEVTVDATGTPVGMTGFSLDITRRKQAEATLQEALADKEQLLKQKGLLLHEVNHRVKNSLQLVSSMLLVQSHYIKDDEARQQFIGAYDRVLTVAMVHQRLYEQAETPDRIDVGQYLRDLCTSLASTTFRDHGAIRVVVVADRAVTLTDQAIPLALIVNELLTNAFKYAFSAGAEGTITVTFRIEADGRRLTVADDGRGLPDGFDPARSGGLGIRLVTGFVAQLGGTLTAGGAERGARFEIVLPAGDDPVRHGMSS